MSLCLSVSLSSSPICLLFSELLSISESGSNFCLPGHTPQVTLLAGKDHMLPIFLPEGVPGLCILPALSLKKADGNTRGGKDSHRVTFFFFLMFIHF